MQERTQTAEDEAGKSHPASDAGRSGKKRPDQSYWSLVKHQYRKNRIALVALWFIYALAAIALLADFIANDKPLYCVYRGDTYFPIVKSYLVELKLSTWPPELSTADWKRLEYDNVIFPVIPYSPGTVNLDASLQEPFSGSDHYLGTDQTGRDILSGLIHGTRISLTIGFVAMGIATLIGVVLGALSGYFGGWVDIVISRVVEVFLNFPVLFLILAIVAFFEYSIFLVMVVIGITGWMGIARLVRGEVLRVRNMEYVTAASSLGFSSGRVIFRHVLPNSIAPVLVSVAFGIAGAILTESALSFLGFGVPPEIVTWGSALTQARKDIDSWWLAVFPGFMIFLTVVSYNLIGDGLRDATDPRLRD